ncbi:MAG TPA: Sapep family Mn(2+)-dependent dipeptidase [Mesotoga infera]|nr:Sapep family Mn(2+)-dependent dipeptidase [Mesotoga infera]
MKELIEEYFERNKDLMIEDIAKLVRIKSDRQEAKEGKPFGEGPAEVLAVALETASKMGFRTCNYDNYVGAIDLNDHERKLDILAHLDVVPAGNGWSITEPFEPFIRDGRIYGRGTADDKGPAVAALYAMKAVKDLNIPLKTGARLILGTDEECGSSDIRYYYGVETEAPMTFSPDIGFPVVNIEKGGLQGSFASEFEESNTTPGVSSLRSGVKSNVVPGDSIAIIEGMELYKIEGYCNAVSERTGVLFELSTSGNITTVKAKGVQVHAATPGKGNNALTAMLEVLSSIPFPESEGIEKLRALNAIFPHGDWLGKSAGIAMSDELSGDLTISLNILDYDGSSLCGSFDCRAPLCATRENLVDVIRERLARHGIRLENNDMYPPHHVSGESPFVQTLLKCYELYTGNKGYCIAIGGGSYVHRLKNGVGFGCTMPGTDNNMHGADEFAVIDELVTSAKIFAQAIIEICQ